MGGTEETGEGHICIGYEFPSSFIRCYNYINVQKAN